MATFVCIDKNTKKIKDDSTFPNYVNNAESDKYNECRRFVLFSLPPTYYVIYPLVNTIIEEYGLPHTKVRCSLPKGHEFYHREYVLIDELEIKLFDNSVECNEYRPQRVKAFIKTDGIVTVDV